MRILVIEDEPGIANFVKQGLEEESFAVDVAYDGTSGLDMALSGDYDLLLLDWMIPGISGIEVCHRTQIIESVWDIHFEYNTGVIDVYINALRKKLRLEEPGPHIKTIRGVGYIAKEA